MNQFRHTFEEYSKDASAEYSGSLKHSQSMMLAHKTINEVIEQYFDGSSLKIIEIGGGHGDIMKELSDAGHKTTSVTNNSTEYESIKGKNLNAYQGDMHNLSELETDFDLLLISHVFEHSFAPYVLMTEFNELLKQNGIAIVIVPNQERKWVFEDFHYIVPTADQLQNLGEKCGFKMLKCEIESFCNMDHLIFIGQKERYWKHE